jgi:hypothetical protein
MYKTIPFLILFLSSCKSTEKCDAYAVTVCDTITFPPIHVHDWQNNKWVCNEFPADTIEVDKVLTLK